uniref:C-type lectin domain-containing protein n=1 Tax=Cavia porcellus TaxID=10141 RepID=H0UX73_CAVPO|nr:NKG2-A/NKG2-B type II integral membrane protein-like [Cavia porcellus]
MSNQQVMYSELNLNKDPKKQQGKPKGTKSSISENEQDITYAELAFQSASQEHRGNDKQHTCKDFTSSPQKLLAATLGTTCLILMVTVIVMVTVVIPSSVMQEQNKSSLVRTAKEVHNLSSAYPCGHCPNEWLIFSNNCYYFGVEKKNWTESLASCTSKKSNLFYIDDEKEMKFLRVLSRPSWIGVSRSGRDHPWLSVNGSAFNMKVQNSSSNESNCVWLSLSGFMAENCGSSLTYNCKHKF